MNDLRQRENPVLYWFSKVGDFFTLSVVWLLLCLPVLTFIPASIALYDSIAHCVHGDEDGSIGRFFRTLKKELLRGLLLSVIWVVFSAMLVFGFGTLFRMGQENQIMAYYSLIYLCSMTIPLGILAWLIPVQSRFEHSFFSLFRAAAVYAITHLPTTVMLLVILAVAAVLVFFFPVLVVLVPAIAVTLQCWFVERVFKKYIPQEENADDDEF